MIINGCTVGIICLALFCLSRELAFLKLRRRLEAIEARIKELEAKK